MNPPEYVDKDKSLIERYLFTPGKLSSLTNYFAKVNKILCVFKITSSHHGNYTK